MNEPNLLIVLTDQQSWWTLSLYGGTLVSTPHIDRIGLEGAKLNQYFTNSALCTPSRGCFFTGRYPHANGAFSNCIPLNRDEVTFGQVLRDYGYRTGYFGKWHLDGTLRPGWIHPERTMGFQESRCMFNRGTWKKIEDLPMRDTSPAVFSFKEVGDEETYATDWLTHKAISFMTRPDDSPFCCVIGYPDPHGPFTVRAPYDKLFKPEDLPLWTTFDEDRVPDWARERRDTKGFRTPRVEREETFRTRMAGYLGQVKLIDDSVGVALRALEEQGILDQTVVVFTTDHGEYMGEHGLYGKNELYETAYRIPFVVRWPRKILAGTQVDRLISSVDFQTTILSLLEVPPCGREQGRDAASLLEGKSIDWTDEIYIHHSSHQGAGVFTEEWELAYVEGGDPILFNRSRDPDQANNLFGVSRYAEIVKYLTGRVVRHHNRVRSPASKWLNGISESSVRASVSLHKAADRSSQHSSPPRRPLLKLSPELVRSQMKRLESRRVYTRDDYEALIHPFLESGFESLRLLDFVRLEEFGDRKALLVRHDLDHDHHTALRIAEWEVDHGVRSTYCVLHGAWYYGELHDGHYSHTEDLLECTRRLTELGHEIILHNNLVVVALQKGIDPARILGEELEFFRSSGVEIHGTSTHGDPLCRKLNFRNWEIFRECCDDRFGGPRTLRDERGGQTTAVDLGSISYRDYGLEYEAYDIARDIYFTDSGGKLRRYSNTPEDNKKLFLSGRRPFSRRDPSRGAVVGVLTHPIWWKF